MNTIKHYDAYLTYSKISDIQQNAIRKLMSDQGLDIGVYDNALEFSFEGRDIGNTIIDTFVKISSILQNASGEIRCEIDDDEFLDPFYEFYTIVNSFLWKQTGKLVRSEQKVRIQP